MIFASKTKQYHHHQKQQQKPTTFVLLGIEPRANILPMSHIPKPLSYYLTVFGKVVHSPEMEILPQNKEIILFKRIAR